MKIVALSSLSWSLINFRGNLLQDMVRGGHEVVACAPDEDEEVRLELARWGVRLCRVPLARASLNPIKDFMSLIGYVRLLFAERPQAIIAYTQKPIVLGGLASRLFRRTRLFVLMSGLGYIYGSDTDKRPVLRSLVSRLYRFAVARAEVIFVFNSDDRATMTENSIIRNDHRVVQVPGSGVDTNRFAFAPIPSGPPVVLMIARLMRDKGVHEFVTAAHIIQQRLPEVRFQLVGRVEKENPTGISLEEIEHWSRSGLIELIGETRDVRPFLRSAHLFVLPSWYREGLPRTILEALSIGRPVITTNLPGCREAIVEGENGWLVAPRDSQALAAAISTALCDPGRLSEMGKSARRTAETVYEVGAVNRLLIREMRLEDLDSRRNDGKSAGDAAAQVFGAPV